jgi:DNA polymerase III sliding clamp (beta) subunit (PCNA family)
MPLQCKMSRTQLRKALDTVRKALPPQRWKLEDSYYNTVLIEANDQGVFLVATNGILRLATRIDDARAISAMGACAVSYAQLLGTVKTLPRMATLTLEQRGDALRLSDGREEIALDCLEAAVYPTLAPVRATGETYTVEDRQTCGDGAPQVQSHTITRAYEVCGTYYQALWIDRDTLMRALETVAFAAASDAARPVLTAVHAMLHQDWLTLVAGDGYRLAECSFPAFGNGTWYHPLLVPARFFLMALELLPAGSRLVLTSRGTTDRLVNENGRTVANAEPFLNPAPVQLSDGEGATVVAIRLIQGKFLNYDDVVPAELPTRAVCETAALSEALRAMVFVAERVTFDFREGLRLEAKSKKYPKP